MQHIRRLLSLLAVVAVLVIALVRPGHARADVAPAPTSPAQGRTPQGHRTQSRLLFGVRVADYAKRFRGVRYVYGGTSPRSGFDCSGFVRFVYAHFGISLAHSSYAQFGDGRRVSRSSLRPGDLVFFDGLGHVGIYVGGGRFIHAPHTGTRVRIEQLAGWYSARFAGATRLRAA
jgi:cell wall-associated NlpC family hydrolase